MRHKPHNAAIPITKGMNPRKAVMCSSDGLDFAQGGEMRSSVRRVESRQEAAELFMRRWNMPAYNDVMLAALTGDHG